MGTLTSTQNWAGREVGGVVLGEPAILEDGSFMWDHPGIPGDVIDDDGDIFMEVDDAQAPA